MSNIKKGFTFLEMILYVAIVSFFVGGVVIYAWNIILGDVKSSVIREVDDNLRIVSSKLSYEIRNAQSVTLNSGSSITLTLDDASRNPTLIDLDNGRIRFGFGSSGACTYASPCYLTGSDIIVETFNLEDLSDPAGTAQIIRYSITLRNENNNGKQEWNYSQSAVSSVGTRSQ